MLAPFVFALMLLLLDRKIFHLHVFHPLQYNPFTYYFLVLVKLQFTTKENVLHENVKYFTNMCFISFHIIDMYLQAKVYQINAYPPL